MQNMATERVWLLGIIQLILEQEINKITNKDS